MHFESIPTVDLKDYIQGDTSQREAFIQKLGDSFSNIGFAIISNHGVSSELIYKAYSAFEKFFALPDEIKQKYEIPGIHGQRGYISKGKEHAKNSNVGDLKEFYHIGQVVNDGDSIKELYPDNIYVNEVPEIEQYGVALYQALEKAGKELLRAIAEYLDLESNYFDAKVHNGNSILRPIHYFPIENPELIPPGAVRAAEHEDINLITLLVGASADGLEVKNTEGKWIAARPAPHQIVVNVGDMLQRLTNNKLASTTHRVVNPPTEMMKQPRYSIPFFMHPRADMNLDALDSCIDENNPKAYEDITAGAYLEERLREIGLKA